MNSYRVQRVFPGEKLFDDYLRLRYQVYCLERGFEDPKEFPDGMETDIYDGHSVHLAAINDQTGEVVGSARIILHSPLGFPLCDHFPLDHIENPPPVRSVGEISRLAVSKKFCKDFQIIAKLLDHLYLESGRLGLTHWYAAMAKGLSVLLKRRKIFFRKVGPELEFHGPRAPFFLDLARMSGECSHFAYYYGDLDLQRPARNWGYPRVAMTSIG